MSAPYLPAMEVMTCSQCMRCRVRPEALQWYVATVAQIGFARRENYHQLAYTTFVSACEVDMMSR